MGTLISAESVRDMQGDPRLRVLDCRYSLADEEAGLRAFRESHLPGAQYVDLGLDMSAEVIPGQTGRHPLPEREAFADCLSHLGVANDSVIVAYDDGAGAFAARLWWMVRWLGHDEVYVMDGGFARWQSLGLPTTDESFTPDITDFEVNKSLARMVSVNSVQSAGLLLDGRDEARYRGEQEPIDRVAGHIPGAVCAPFSQNVSADGCMRSVDELSERFSALGVAADADVVCYCGSGVTAAHNVLAIVHAGLPEPALYPGSWSEWITDPNRPVETG